MWALTRQSADLLYPYSEHLRRGLIMINYAIVIYWSDEEDAFIAEVPELPGCMADGTTYQDALSNMQLVMQEWIETAEEVGRPIPQPKGRLVLT